MRISVPKELKNHEDRVALTPAGVHDLSGAGHQVTVESGAGVESGFTDATYEAAGAKIVENQGALWEDAELVVKVKEPTPAEYQFLRPDLTIFAYLHLAADPELARVLMESRTTAISYETVETDSGELPLLAPMSEVAGRLGVQVGAYHLMKPVGGPGVLMG
ncbi:alanine dehydrogenase, partial [Timonella senegalensis]